MRLRPIVLALAACALFPTTALARTSGEPTPFGHACTSQDGVRFCPSEGLQQRVPSFDGVPLDADVTLPATGSGPFPTIVMLHGWSGSTTSFESWIEALASESRRMFFLMNSTARNAPVVTACIEAPVNQ